MPNPSSVLVRLRLIGGQQFQKGAKSAAGGLRDMSRGGSVASRALGGVNAALGVTGAAMRAVGTAGAVALGTGLAYGIKTAANFEQSMANVQARLLTSKANMELLSDQAIKLGADTAFSAQQSADAMGEYAAAGFNANEIMKIMPGTLDLAAASGTDLASAAELTGAIIRQFGLHAKDAGHVADVMTVAVNKSAISMDDLAYSMKYVGPVAGRFGQSLEDIGAATAILGNVGIKGETAGTTLRRALVNIVKPSKRTVDMLDGMGITMDDFNKATIDAKGNLRPMPQILGNLSGAFSGLTKPQKRKALAQLFGVEALPGMLTLVGMGQKKIDKMSASLLNSGGAAKKTAGIMRGTVKGAWDQFTGGIETAAIMLTRRLNPALRGGLLKASGLVGKASRSVNGFIDGVTGKKQAPVKAATGRMTGAMDIQDQRKPLSAAQQQGGKVRAMIGGVVAWAKKTLPALGASAMAWGKQFLDALKPAAPFLNNILVPLLKGVLAGVMVSVIGAFKMIIPIVRVVATVLGWVGQKLAFLKPVFFALGFAIGFIYSGPILKLLGGLKYLGLAFRVLATPVRIMNAVFGFLARGIVKLVGWYIKANLHVLQFASTFTSIPGRVIKAAVKLVQGVIDQVKLLPTRLHLLAISAGSRLMQGISSGARKFLAPITSFFGRVGKSILDAVVNAIKSAPGAVAEAIMSVVPGPVKGVVKKLLPGMASGGVARRGGMAVVGERGPELVDLPTGSTVYSNRESRRAMASVEGLPPIVLTANLNVDGKRIHTVVLKTNEKTEEAK